MYKQILQTREIFLSLIVLFFFPKGANVNAAKLHETALHHAAKAKNVDLIELLAEFGGNMYARDNLNRKPIHYTSPGSPSYLCLEFYESEFVYSECGSCHCLYIGHLRAQIKCPLCRFLFLRDPPQSTTDQQSGCERDSWPKSM